MALQTFSPGRNPNLGMAYQQRPRVLSAAFGDGYVQRTADGLNTMPRSYRLEWAPCTPAEADYIIGFFETHGGVTPFWWTSPRDGSPRKYTCPEWERTEPQWNASGVSATFVEDFGLAV
jgi:phage-related protein